MGNLTAEQLADALDCFWNAAIYEARQSDDHQVIATVAACAVGFAAVAERLRENTGD